VPFFANGSVSSTRTGWTVGGGIDYAVTNNWSIFAEYRYTNFGSIRENNFGQLPMRLYVQREPSDTTKPGAGRLQL
jgi:outer membrane autotransporter protein